MYSYDQVLADVKDVYEQLTGLSAPEVDVKKPRFPLPKGVNPVTLVQSEINQLNMYLINSGISWRLSKSPNWTPPAEIYETQDAFVISLELPGVNEEDVTVSQTNNVLVVRGKRRFQKASEDSRYYSSERAYGVFERMFPLPGYVRADSLEQEFDNGILLITIPKTGKSGK
jgi:HSP20 family protein